MGSTLESMIEVVEEKLCENWSPEQVSGWLLEERCERLSHERIYQHIWADKASGVNYTPTSGARERSIRSAVKENAAEGRSATVQALRSARTLWMPSHG